MSKIRIRAVPFFLIRKVILWMMLQKNLKLNYIEHNSIEEGKMQEGFLANFFQFRRESIKREGILVKYQKKWKMWRAEMERADRRTGAGRSRRKQKSAGFFSMPILLTPQYQRKIYEQNQTAFRSDPIRPQYPHPGCCSWRSIPNRKQH